LCEGDGRESRVKYRELSDEELMYCYVSGEVRAFDIIVSRYTQRLFQFAFRLLGDAQMAQDVVQEAFLRVHLHAGRYKYGVAKFSTWVYRIARNLTIQEFRKQKRRKARESGAEAAEEHADEPERELLNAEFNAMLQKALEGLPEEQRTVFALRDIEHMTYEEIAKVTRARVGTVKSRLNRARNALARELAPYVGRRPK